MVRFELPDDPLGFGLKSRDSLCLTLLEFRNRSQGLPNRTRAQFSSMTLTCVNMLRRSYGRRSDIWVPAKSGKGGGLRLREDQ